MYGGLHRNLRLWRIISIKVASKWRNEIHGNRKLSKRRYLSMFLVAVCTNWQGSVGSF